jgi:hypothetical protein
VGEVKAVLEELRVEERRSGRRGDGRELFEAVRMGIRDVLACGEEACICVSSSGGVGDDRSGGKPMCRGDGGRPMGDVRPSIAAASESS